MNKEDKKRKYKSRRAYYSFSRFAVDESMVMPAFETRDLAISARSAAHVMAYTKGWKFKTKTRETDAGCFELTVCRVL
jgi:hypothetical protein